jgi:outer membrane cobalamin receptor
MNVLSKISAIIIFFVSFFVTLAAHSQSPEIDIYELSIDELTKLKLVTASKIEQDAEKINATVKVITSNDIAERGYLSIV